MEGLLVLFAATYLTTYFSSNFFLNQKIDRGSKTVSAKLRHRQAP